MSKVKRRKRKTPHFKLGKLCIIAKYFDEELVTAKTYSSKTEKKLINKKWFYLF